jgi:hypothetical protein
MIFIAVAALTAHALFGTMWSNHCDPGNERFNVLKSDPSSHSAPVESSLPSRTMARTTAGCASAQASRQIRLKDGKVLTDERVHSNGALTGVA